MNERRDGAKMRNPKPPLVFLIFAPFCCAPDAEIEWSGIMKKDGAIYYAAAADITLNGWQHC